MSEHECEFIHDAVGTLYQDGEIYQRYVPDSACECGKTKGMTREVQLEMLAEADAAYTERQAKGNEV